MHGITSLLFFWHYFPVTMSLSILLECLLGSNPGRIFVIEVVHIQRSKLSKNLECAVLPLWECKFMSPGFVSYLGGRGVLCVGNGWHFCFEHVQYNVWGPWVEYFRVYKVSEKKICTVIFLKSLKGFGWNNVDPASVRRGQWPNLIS